MTTPDQVNAPQTSFNEELQLYNGVNPPTPKSYNFITRKPDNGIAAPGQIPTATRKVLTDLNATASDTTTLKTVTADSEQIPRQPITGSFAAVRALRVLHQHRIGFWSEAGIIDQFAASKSADPTPEQINDAYNIFQVFSYLPSAIAPSAQVFADLITPSKSASNVKNALERMGIRTAIVTNPVPTLVVAPAAATLPDNVPFASNLSQFCALP